MTFNPCRDFMQSLRDFMQSPRDFLQSVFPRFSHNFTLKNPIQSTCPHESCRLFRSAVLSRLISLLISPVRPLASRNLVNLVNYSACGGDCFSRYFCDFCAFCETNSCCVSRNLLDPRDLCPQGKELFVILLLGLRRFSSQSE